MYPFICIEAQWYIIYGVKRTPPCSEPNRKPPIVRYEPVNKRMVMITDVNKFGYVRSQLFNLDECPWLTAWFWFPSHSCLSVLLFLKIACPLLFLMACGSLGRRTITFFSPLCTSLALAPYFYRQISAECMMWLVSPCVLPGIFPINFRLGQWRAEVC